ncbi:MAG: hypothetical protein QXX38_00385 [Candidatus Aenigmatarchaeota archaeon]
MSNIQYITTRILQNSSGENKGRVRVVVLKGETRAMVEYTCPECSYSEKKFETWKKPFGFKCSNCNLWIKVPSLRSEIKKMKK